MTVTKRMDELNVNDVIYQYGALLIIKDIWCYEDDRNGRTVIRFKTSPYNNKSIDILGNFYCNGTYGGYADVSITCYVKDGETNVHIQR